MSDILRTERVKEPLHMCPFCYAHFLHIDLLLVLRTLQKPVWCYLTYKTYMCFYFYYILLTISNSLLFSAHWQWKA